jgi:flagellar motor switch protein FliM
VQLSAVLAKTEVRIGDFLNLHVGDVITTSNKISQEVDVFIRHRKKFTGRPGLVGRKRGLVVTQVHEELGKE